MATKGGGSATLSWHELQHLQALTRPANTRDVSTQKLIRKRRSEQRYKNWNNTLEALRERKEQERQNRLKQIEEAQLQLDREAAAHKAMQRKRAIDRANRLLYEQSGKVREFRSAMLLTEVIQAQEAQKKKKEKKKQLHQKIDKVYDEMIVKQQTSMQAREEYERKHRKEMDRQYREQQAQQRAKIAERKAKERAAELEIGRKLKEAAIIAEQEAQRAAVQRHKDQREMNKSMLAANKRLADLRAARKAEEAKEALKVMQYADERARIAAQRKAEAEARFQEKMAQRQELIDAQAKHLKDMNDREERKLAKDVAELQRRQEERAHNDVQQKKELAAQIERSRQAQMRRRAELKKKADAEEAEMVKNWRARSTAHAEQERQRRILARKKELDRVEFLRQQQLAKEARLAKEKEEERAATLAAIKQQEEEEKAFQAYTEQLLREFGVDEEAAPVKVLKQRKGTQRFSDTYPAARRNKVKKDT